LSGRDGMEPDRLPGSADDLRPGGVLRGVAERCNEDRAGLVVGARRQDGDGRWRGRSVGVCLVGGSDELDDEQDRRAQKRSMPAEALESMLHASLAFVRVWRTGQASTCRFVGMS